MFLQMWEVCKKRNEDFTCFYPWKDVPCPVSANGFVQPYPFATNGGWIGHTFKDFGKACSSASVQAGLNIRFNEDQQLTTDADVLKWAQQIKR